MRNWPALIVAPLLALTNLSITYALVEPACRHDRFVWLHASALLSLVLVLLFAASAGRNWVSLRSARHTSSDAFSTRGEFFALVGCLCALFSAVLVIALWLPQWIVSPCRS